ncbi:MAG: MFS transporter [Desulfobacterales bacterium]|jgi:EmrB/QacA subfamily drug resistance transporter
MVRSESRKSRSQPEPFNKWLIFSLVAVGIFMSTLDGSIVNVALPTIMAELGVPLITVKWVVVIYLLVISSLLLSFGRLSDMWGRRWVYSRGLAVFSLGSLLCGLSPGALWLIASRALQGVGAAMIMACTPALVVDVFPATERGRALGMLGTVVAGGLTMGPALGGMLLQFFPWRVIFYINVPVGIAAALATLKVLKRQSETTSPEAFDWTGSILLMVCFTALLTVLSRSNEWGYTSPPTLALAGIFVISAIFLIWQETRTRHPIVEPGLFLNRLFSISIAAAVTLFISLSMISFLMPFYLVNPAGFAPAKTGGVLVIPFFFLFIGAPLAGATSDRIGSRLLCTLGMFILAFCLLSFAWMPASTEIWPVAWRLALSGIGVATFSSPNSAAAMSAVTSQRRGIAAALVATARNFGMVFGVTAAAVIFNLSFQKASGGQSLQNYHHGMEPAFMTAFHQAMLCGAAFALLGALLSALRGKEKRWAALDS